MLNRRDFLACTAGAAVFAGARGMHSARAEDTPPTILRLERRTLEVNGKAASVYALRQPDGTFGITTDVSKPFRVRVENAIEQPSLIHWHGLTPPWRQDGVPGVSGPPIPAGGSQDYDFPLKAGGTYWMHSHYGLQEQLLMSAPLIIQDGRNRRDEQDVVLLLSDFTFKAPEEVLEGLRKGGMASVHGMASMPGMSMGAPAEPKMPGMAMSGAAPVTPDAPAPDLNDVEYDAFLANDRTLADPQIVQVEPGGRVLLRVINGSSMSNYTVDLGRQEGELTAVDGIPVQPIRGSRFPLAVAQRLEIRLDLARQPAAYPILAVLEGERRQTGLVLVAGRAPVTRVPDLAEAASPALTLDLERRLRAVEPLMARPADRVHAVDLTGSMQGYVWTLNGIAFGQDTPLPVAAGQRVEIVMVNRTAMPHPMHLHGHSFQVVQIDDGPRFAGAVRDTVLVPPRTRVVMAFDAGNPGRWAFHCHLLYHMHAGMMTTLRYV